MAIKITKAGRPPEGTPPVHNTQCVACGCKFEFTESDVEQQEVYGKSTFWNLPCPQKGCGKNIRIQMRKP